MFLSFVSNLAFNNAVKSQYIPVLFCRLPKLDGTHYKWLRNQPTLHLTGVRGRTDSWEPHTPQDPWQGWDSPWQSLESALDSSLDSCCGNDDLEFHISCHHDVTTCLGCFTLGHQRQLRQTVWIIYNSNIISTIMLLVIMIHRQISTLLIRQINFWRQFQSRLPDIDNFTNLETFTRYSVGILQHWQF